MLDHVSIPIADVERAAAFYDAVLATIGLGRRKERPGAIGYGPGTRAATGAEFRRYGFDKNDPLHWCWKQ